MVASIGLEVSLEFVAKEEAILHVSKLASGTWHVILLDIYSADLMINTKNARTEPNCRVVYVGL
jgi:hypothetical protein